MDYTSRDVAAMLNTTPAKITGIARLYCIGTIRYIHGSQTKFFTEHDVEKIIAIKKGTYKTPRESDMLDVEHPLVTDARWLETSNFPDSVPYMFIGLDEEDIV